MNKYKNLTDNELDAEIERQYGADWQIEDLPPDSELFEEVWNRMASSGNPEYFDLDVIRKILLHIEKRQDTPREVLNIDDFICVCNNPRILTENIEVLEDAGYIELTKSSRGYISEGVGGVKCITFDGYEYLDAVRNDDVWQKVK